MDISSPQFCKLISSINYHTFNHPHTNQLKEERHVQLGQKMQEEQTMKKWTDHNSKMPGSAS